MYIYLLVDCIKSAVRMLEFGLGMNIDDMIFLTNYHYLQLKFCAGNTMEHERIGNIFSW